MNVHIKIFIYIKFYSYWLLNDEFDFVKTLVIALQTRNC